MIKFDFNDVSANWAICFNNDCPLASTCMRKWVGDQAPESLTTAKCVTPHALKDGHCELFHEISTVTMARGFSSIFTPVKKCDFTPMRKALTDYLHGKKMYYEYRRGERLLMPEQQQWINGLFRQYGYEEPVTFDSTEEVYLIE